MRSGFAVKKINWIVIPESQKKVRVSVRVRSNGEMIDGVITPDKNITRVRLKKPQFAIASGQSAVFYKKDIVLGGGVIHTKLIKD